MATDKEVLQEARRLLDAGWIQQGWAGKKAFDAVERENGATSALVRMGNPMHNNMDCYCLTGAVYRAVINLGDEVKEGTVEQGTYISAQADRIFESLLSALPPKWRVCTTTRACLVVWQDRHKTTKAGVLALVDKVLAGQQPVDSDLPF